MQIRAANFDDYEALCSVDTVAQQSTERQRQILSWLQSADCYLVEIDDEIAAYGVVGSYFFGYPFIEMVMVGERFRRQGGGALIIRHIQSVVTDSKLFSSTNASNTAMQMLFAKLEFKQTGQIDNLDEGDPEIIFYRPKAATK